jgi:hypothetical protein
MKTTSTLSISSLLGRWLDAFRRHLVIPPVWFDVVLFGLSSVFALVLAFVSKIPLYRQWGQLAVAPYLVGTGLALGMALAAKGRAMLRWRLALTSLVILGATVIPAAFEVSWRFEVQPQSLHVQPEVVVIERAASFVAHGKDPYQAHVVHGHLDRAAPGLPAYESFFPYLPAMVLFGLPAATGLTHQASDARLVFLTFTLLVVALALSWAPGAGGRRLRALQVAIALPWAALALATGGDDLPIVALVLAAMVLAQRRRPGWSGLLFGVACAMKMTAWPVALLALFAARDMKGRRRPWIMAAGTCVVVVPLLFAALLADAQTFVANVVEFPLGLAGVASPAGSALPGHLLVSAFPVLHKEFVVLCVLLGAVALVWFLRRHPPEDAGGACRVAAWTLTGAILLAPATRIGYLIYPLNLFVWSWMLTPGDELERGEDPVLYASLDA